MLHLPKQAFFGKGFCGRIVMQQQRIFIWCQREVFFIVQHPIRRYIRASNVERSSAFLYAERYAAAMDDLRIVKHKIHIQCPVLISICANYCSLHNKDQPFSDSAI